MSHLSSLIAITLTAAINLAPPVHADTDDERCRGVPDVLTSFEGVDFVRTPDACFRRLRDFAYEPRYVEIEGLRQAYVDEGPADADPILLLHGQPSWSYLYRKMIPVLVDGGHRVIAMDHLGMGRSDKPIDIDYYDYQLHTRRLEAFIEQLDLTNITLFAQDWGSLIGLQVAGVNSERFDRLVIGDGSLPVLESGEPLYDDVPFPRWPDDTIPSPFANIPDQQEPFYDENGELITPGFEQGFFLWMNYAMRNPDFRPSEVLEALTWFPMSRETEAAYDAPFPNRMYMAGVRKFPSIVNDLPGETLTAWYGLANFRRPVLTIWASNDGGGQGTPEAQQAIISSIPGAYDQPHTRLPESGHFLQDDQGEEIAHRINDFIASTPIAMEGLHVDTACVLFDVAADTERAIRDTATGTLYVAGGEAAIPEAEWADYVPSPPYERAGARDGLTTASCFLRSPAAPPNCSGTQCLQFQEIDTYSWYVAREQRKSACLPDAQGCTGEIPADGFLLRDGVDECRSNTFTGAVFEVRDPEGQAYLMRSTTAGEFPDPAVALPSGWSFAVAPLPELESPFIESQVTAYPNDAAGFCSQTVLIDSAGQEYYELYATSTALPPEEDPDAPTVVVERYNGRFCEILLGNIEGRELVVDIYNTSDLNTCPQALWEALDAQQIAEENDAQIALLNGPNFWLMDETIVLSDIGVNPEPVSFGGIEMLQITQSRRPLSNGGPYTSTFVERDTAYRYAAGRKVYELTDPDGRRFMMQYFSRIEEELDINDLVGLAQRLQLPDGWTFGSRVLDTPYDLRSVDGIAEVIADDLANSYQLVPE